MLLVLKEKGHQGSGVSVHCTTSIDCVFLHILGESFFNTFLSK